VRFKGRTPRGRRRISYKNRINSEKSILPEYAKAPGTWKKNTSVFRGLPWSRKKKPAAEYSSRLQKIKKAIR